MAKSEFSETQFVFAYLWELFQSYAGTVWSPLGTPYFTLPSTVTEKEVPADFLFRHYSHSEYFQFKRSDRLKYKRGPLEVNAGVPDSFRTYYRFHVYNRRTNRPDGTVKVGQFEKLRELAAANINDSVYYCAPCFHTEEEFFTHFNDASGTGITSNSIRIDCNQFNNLNFQSPIYDVMDDHCIVYRLDSSTAYVCSQAQEIKAEKGVVLERPASDQQDFRFYMVNKLMESEKIGLSATRDVSAGIDLLRDIRRLQTHFIMTYNILWFPMFRNFNG